MSTFTLSHALPRVRGLMKKEGVEEIGSVRNSCSNFNLSEGGKSEDDARKPPPHNNYREIRFEGKSLSLGGAHQRVSCDR